MSERPCEQCQALQDHRVFEALTPFLPPEQAMQKRKWEAWINEYARNIIRQAQGAKATATMQPLSETAMQDRILTDPHIVRLQKCIAVLAISETPRMLQTWSCQRKIEED